MDTIMTTYKWRNNILCEVLIIHQGKIKSLAKKMVDEMDEIEPCLVIAILMVVPQNTFGFIALPQERFLFIVFSNPNGYSLPCGMTIGNVVNQKGLN